MKLTTQLIAGLIVMVVVLFLCTLTDHKEIRQKEQIIYNLHKLYPCQPNKGETSGQYDTIKIRCLDDRHKPMYNCGDGECNYMCLCHPDPVP